MIIIFQITLPIGILQRWGHSATAITQLPGLEDVIIFGGISESYVGWTIRHKDRCRIAETAIITFGELIQKHIGEVTVGGAMVLSASLNMLLSWITDFAKTGLFK